MSKFEIDGVQLETVERLLPWQARGLCYTASGYGAAIPSAYMVRYAGRWRRVYCTVYSNSGTCWIKVKGEKIFLR